MKPYYADQAVTLHHGDCLEVLRSLPDASVDAVVTDPPYGLGFMGKEWDSGKSFVERKPVRSNTFDHVGGNHNPVDSADAARTRRVESVRFGEWCAVWSVEVFRVLKPGGHLLAFGGTRTVHRLTCAVEDAGFEIRDGIDWLYASGFPKSLDVSKAIDKARDDRADINRVTGWLAAQRDRAGLTNREIDAAFGFNGMAGHWTAAPHLKIAQVPRWEQWQRLRELIGFGDEMDAEVWRLNGRKGTPGHERADRMVTGPAANEVFSPTQRVVRAGTPVLHDARRWSGWGTALKPAREPIVMARKPLAGTVAGNVLAYGTGALNIDACRTAAGQDYRDKCASVVGLDSNRNGDAYGEWTGVRQDSAHAAGRWPSNVVLSHAPDCGEQCLPGCPVAELDRQSGVSRDGVAVNRNRSGIKPASTYGTYGVPEPVDVGYGGQGGASRFFPVFRYEAKAPTAERPRTADGTAHPTVKPLDLMRWLVRLVTPPGGVVLEPFAGSGTTAEACVLEGFRCIAIEREAAYLPLIVARLSKPLQPSLDLFGAA